MHRSHPRHPVVRCAIGAALATCIALATSAVVPSSAHAAYPSFTFTGRGYGHGIGLSQWGAKGWADHDKTGEWIATYYYPGTSILSATERSIAVNLDPNANYRSGGNAGYTRSSWRLLPGYVGSKLVVNGTLNLADSGAPYTFSASAASITVKNKSGTVVGGPYTGKVSVVPSGGSSPALAQVVEGTGNYGRSYVRYRGSMALTASGGKIKLLNKLTMSQYLYGVVPRESPSSWNVEALKAQAIVARSYAQAPGAPNELYCTTYSQAYCGHSHGSDRTKPTTDEAASSNSAVDKTAGKFVGFASAIVRTYFYDSSGGHTANIEDVWQGSDAKSYYRGVDDPYSVDPAVDPWKSPPTYDGMALAGKIGRPAKAATSVYVRSLVLNRADSGFVRTVDVTWSSGVKTNMWGDTFRSKLGLKSTKFFIGTPFTRIAYGSRFSTSIEISKKLYPTGSAPKAVVVANGADEKFADALTASSLAGVAQAPVLLVGGGSIDAVTIAEVRRLKGLGASKLYIVGGASGVRTAAEAQLATAMGGAAAVERLAGSQRYGFDRYGTAASVALKMHALGASGSKVLVASGERWPDAAIAGSVSAASKRPLLLVRAGSVPDGTRLALADLVATETAVFGGDSVVGPAALAQLLAITHEKAPTHRFGTWGGRYDTAVAAADWCSSAFGYTLTSAYVATGDHFPDSITGGMLAAANKHPLLLTGSKSAPTATLNYFAKHRTTITSLVVVGGTGSVSDSVMQKLGLAAD